MNAGLSSRAQPAAGHICRLEKTRAFAPAGLANRFVNRGVYACMVRKVVYQYEPLPNFSGLGGLAAKAAVAGDCQPGWS